MKKKYWLFITPFFILLLIVCFILFSKKDTFLFESICDDFLFYTLSDNELNLHFSLSEKDSFTIENTSSLFPTYSIDECNSYQNILHATLDALSSVNPSKLSQENNNLYHIFTNYTSLQLDSLTYYYFNDPLNPSNGMHLQLPTLMAEYQFSEESDILTYFTLLEHTSNYFLELIDFIVEKNQHSIYVSKESLKKVILQCLSLFPKNLVSSNTHFLQETFVNRIDTLLEETTITQEKRNFYIEENTRLLSEHVIPAYELLAQKLSLLYNDAIEQQGLSSYPNGKEYYEWLISYYTGSSKSIDELYVLLNQKISTILDTLNVNFTTFSTLDTSSLDLDGLLPFAEYNDALLHLKDSIASSFPNAPDLHFTIKEVSPSLSNYTSPAYYLTPPIDSYKDNVIYINPSIASMNLELYTTFAHEGYPGHLYQTVYIYDYTQKHNLHPLRNILYFGGYIEGWGIYSEFAAYNYASSLFSKDSLIYDSYYNLLRIEKELWLAIFSYLDISVHYFGCNLSDITQYLNQFGITNENGILEIYQYILEDPGNYLKYYVGYLEICELKEKAQTLWAHAYSDYSFHKFLLNTGASDFENLNRILEQYPVP